MVALIFGPKVRRTLQTGLLCAHHQRATPRRPHRLREPAPRARPRATSGPHRGQALSPFPGPRRPFQGPRQGPCQCFHGPAGPSRALGPSCGASSGAQAPRATGLTPTRGGTAEKQGFADTRVDQSAQIYVDYEQDAPVARCRERRAVSPMAASASVDKALAGWRTRRRHTNRCNPHRVSSRRRGR